MSEDAPKPLMQLIGWAQKALGKLEAQVSGQPASQPGAPPQPQAARPATGPLSAQRPATGSLQPPAPPARQTGPLKSGSSQLTLSAHARSPRASATGELSLAQPAEPPVSQAAPSETGETPETASKRRLGIIMAYMKNPEGDPSFKNKPLMYRILTEERGYQQEQILKHQQAIAAADPADEEAYSQLEAGLSTAQKRQAQLFTLLKELTGKRGKTGGTGFISTGELPNS